MSWQVGDVRGARERYHALRMLNPSSAAAGRIAGRLAAASATSQPEDVQELEATLPAIDAMSDAEVDRLEGGALGEYACSSDLAHVKRAVEMCTTSISNADAELLTCCIA